MPRWNGPVLTLTHIIKVVMYSASEEELGALLIPYQYMVAMKKTFSK